jgi:DNA-binding response OmpR family regulator
MSFFDRLRKMLATSETAGQSAAHGGDDASGVDNRRQKDRAELNNLTVLVIDDSPTVVASLRRMLEQNGYFVHEAETAETGIEIAMAELPHVIFLDIVLPEMDGFSALRRLRREPLTHKIPIIMMSGNEAATEQFYAQRIGANDFMKKPFSRFEVFSRLEKLIESKQLAAPANTLVWPRIEG